MNSHARAQDGVPEPSTLNGPVAVARPAPLFEIEPELAAIPWLTWPEKAVYAYHRSSTSPRMTTAQIRERLGVNRNVYDAACRTLCGCGLLRRSRKNDQNEAYLYVTLPLAEAEPLVGRGAGRVAGIAQARMRKTVAPGDSEAPRLPLPSSTVDNQHSENADNQRSGIADDQRSGRTDGPPSPTADNLRGVSVDNLPTSTKKRSNRAAAPSSADDQPSLTTATTTVYINEEEVREELRSQANQASIKALAADLAVSFRFNELCKVAGQAHKQGRTLTDVLADWAEHRFAVIARFGKGSKSGRFAAKHIREGELVPADMRERREPAPSAVDPADERRAVTEQPPAPEPEVEPVWGRILARIGDEAGVPFYRFGARCVEIGEHRAVVEFSNAFLLDRFKQTLLPAVEDAFAQEYGRPMQVELYAGLAMSSRAS